MSDDNTATTALTATSAATRQLEAERATGEPEPQVEDVLVEEVSIDGMCGVY